MKTTYHVTPCYFTNPNDYIVFKTGSGLSAFLENTDYHCSVAIATNNSVAPFSEYTHYGENNPPV